MKHIWTYCCWFRNPALVEVGNLYHYLQGFIHPRRCRISSINSSCVNCIFQTLNQCSIGTIDWHLWLVLTLKGFSSPGDKTHRHFRSSPPQKKTQRRWTKIPHFPTQLLSEKNTPYFPFTSSGLIHRTSWTVLLVRCLLFFPSSTTNQNINTNPQPTHHFTYPSLGQSMTFCSGISMSLGGHIVATPMWISHSFGEEWRPFWPHPGWWQGGNSNLGGGNSNIFYVHCSPRKLGMMIQFDEHILQMGWFNHQLVTCWETCSKKEGGPCCWSIKSGGTCSLPFKGTGPEIFRRQEEV